MKKNFDKNISDEELMSLAASGDKNAFVMIYDRWNVRMMSYFYRMLGRDKDKAEDFLQDLFLKIIEKKHLWKKDARFSPWIYAIAYNQCKNEYRKTNGRNEQSSNNSDIPSTENIEINTDNNLFMAKLNSELELLGESKKNIFVLRYKQDLPLKEIAEIAGCSLGTVKSRLFYTIKQLSEKLKEFNPKEKNNEK